MFIAIVCHQSTSRRILPVCQSLKRFKSSSSKSNEILKEELRNTTSDVGEESLYRRIFTASSDNELPAFLRLRNIFLGKEDLVTKLSKARIERERKGQLWCKIRHAALGPDLSAAHFVLYRGGGVKFSHQSEWMYHPKKYKISEDLPFEYDESFTLTGVDISKLNLRLEALTNFNDLAQLTHLSISHCSQANDWWLDFISGKLPSIEHLDISGCPNITHRGISVLYRCNALKSINVEGLPYSPFLEMALFKLEDLLPDVLIFGMDHWSNEIVEAKTDSSPAQ